VVVLDEAARRRVMSDINEIRRSLAAGMWLQLDESDISKLRVTLLGQQHTPYQGGFFTFGINFPSNYRRII